MKEYPILFSGPMVRAILAGRKTQTRRVVKRIKRIDGVDCVMDVDGLPSALGYMNDGTDLCPYGTAGSHLWVRETWTLWDGGEHARRDGRGITFRADCLNKYGVEDLDSQRCRADYGVKWRPSIFLPRWASRLTLEITDVRVERLQDISEADAQAEGVKQHADEDQDGAPDAAQSRSYKQGVKDTWCDLHGAASWAANPFVWVIGFQRLEAK
ncbi:MAG: hypothetical protein U0Y68_27195 [Blastocatellia bacterium]